MEITNGLWIKRIILIRIKYNVIKCKYIKINKCKKLLIKNRDFLKKIILLWVWELEIETYRDNKLEQNCMGGKEN